MKDKKGLKLEYKKFKKQRIIGGISFKGYEDLSTELNDNEEVLALTIVSSFISQSHPSLSPPGVALITNMRILIRPAPENQEPYKDIYFEKINKEAIKINTSIDNVVSLEYDNVLYEFENIKNRQLYEIIK